MKWQSLASFYYENIKLDFVFAVICLSLLYIGNNATKNLTWPYDLDQFRDIAQTQTFLDGGYGNDPYYLDEHTWYNPGIHLMFGMASLLFKTPVPRTLLKFGAFFIILAPLSFYIMIRSMFGNWAAFIGTAAYLFIPSPYPIWVSNLYSPFIFPIIFAQTFFYILVTFFYKSIKKEQKALHYFIMGILLGITFLFHTSSALIAGCIITLFVLEKLIAELKTPNWTIKTLKPLLNKFLYFVIPAFIISMIFLYFIVVHYRLKIINASPTNWMWKLFTLKRLPQLLITELFYLPTIIAIFGFLYLIKKKENEIAKKISQYWLGIVLAYLGFYFLTIELKSIFSKLPLIVPAYHFFFYLKALSYVLFGYGTVILAGMLGKIIEKRFMFARKWHQLLACKNLKLRPLFYLLIAVLSLFYVLTLYDHNEWLKTSKEAAFHQTSNNPAVKSYNWIRRNTKNNDVFLCSDKFSMRIVGPAARKVVATHPFFSNPYVNYEERSNDRANMFKCLESGELSVFSRLCTKYKVKYIIENTSVLRKTHPLLKKYLKRAFICGDIVIKKIALINP